jgi:hypothetical protein
MKIRRKQLDYLVSFAVLQSDPGMEKSPSQSNKVTPLTDLGNDTKDDAEKMTSKKSKCDVRRINFGLQLRGVTAKKLDLFFFVLFFTLNTLFFF